MSRSLKEAAGERGSFTCALGKDCSLDAHWVFRVFCNSRSVVRTSLCRGWRPLLLGAKTLLGAPGLTTRNKKLLGTKGIATRSKDATRLEAIARWETFDMPNALFGLDSKTQKVKEGL